MTHHDGTDHSDEVADHTTDPTPAPTTESKGDYVFPVNHDDGKGTQEESAPESEASGGYVKSTDLGDDA